MAKLAVQSTYGRAWFLRYRLVIIGTMAGLLYNIWPLGYVLNRPALEQGVVSDLEAAHQPFNWFFQAGDIITSLVVLWLILAIVRQQNNDAGWRSWSVFGLGLFSLGTAYGALDALHCGVNLAICGVSSKQIFDSHDVISFVAVLGLALALYGAGLFHRQQCGHKRYTTLLLATSAAWSVTGLLFLVTCFTTKPSFMLQQIFIALSGLSVVVVAIVYGCDKSTT